MFWKVQSVAGELRGAVFLYQTKRRIVKPNLNHARIMLTITLALPLVLATLAVISRLSGSADATLSFLLLCTVSVYVSLAAGLLMPLGIANLWLFGGSIERRTILALTLLSVLNVAVALTWISMVVPHVRFRY